MTKELVLSDGSIVNFGEEVFAIYNNYGDLVTYFNKEDTLAIGKAIYNNYLKDKTKDIFIQNK